MLIKGFPLILFFSCVLGFPKKVHIGERDFTSRVLLDEKLADLKNCSFTLPANLLGGLFDSDDEIQRCFETSVKAVNRERHENSEFANVFLVAESSQVNTDPFAVSLKGTVHCQRRVAVPFSIRWTSLECSVCELLELGVAGIFGPQNKVTAEHVQSMCDTMEMPHIYTRWEPSQVRGRGINLYPHAETLAMVGRIREAFSIRNCLETFITVSFNCSEFTSAGRSLIY